MTKCVDLLAECVVAALFVAAVCTAPAMAQGESKAPMRFLCAGALKGSMASLLAQFTIQTGNNVEVAYGPIGQNAQRVRQGELADLVVVSPDQWELLRKDGKIDSGVRVVVGKVGIGIFVKKGATRPDIPTLEAFKRTMLSASGIAVGDPARGTPVGAYVVPLFDRLGIAEAVKPKLRLAMPGTSAAVHGSVYDVVTRGDAEIGFAQMSEASEVPEVEIVAPLPGEIQQYTVFVMAIPVQARDRTTARSLADFLTSSPAVSTLKTKGIDPG